LKQFLESLKFHYINVDHFIFVNCKKKLIIIIYVDDLLIVDSKSIAKISKLKKKFVDRFKITNLKSCYYYLNMKITRDRRNYTLHISQRIYIEKMLKRFNMLSYKVDTTFMSTSIHLVVEIDQQVFNEVVKHYQLIIDSLMYAIIEIRSNIAYAMLVLSRFCNNSNKTHEIATKHVLRYLKDILHIEIIYKEND